jgi:hypothetical protein
MAELKGVEMSENLLGEAVEEFDERECLEGVQSDEYSPISGLALSVQHHDAELS